MNDGAHLRPHPHANPHPILEVEDLRVEIAGTRILDAVTFAMEEGEVVAVVGPNGAGKTTLIRTLYRSERPLHGVIRIAGRLLSDFSQNELAKNVAVLRQEDAGDFDFTVEELVMLGRSPHQKWLAGETQHDRAIVARALTMVDMAPFARRSFHSLSAGERQRVLLARAIAQEPRLLLLDEPISHLDMRLKLEILARVRALGIGVLAVLHDLSLVEGFASRVLVLERGRVRALGVAGEVMVPHVLEPVFGVGVERLLTLRGQSLLAFFRRQD